MAWLSGWNYRKKITIQDANVDGNLSNFPVYVDITADSDIGGNVSDTTNGYDIRFTDADEETLLKYEREHFSVSAGDATGHYWVKVPNVYASPSGTQNEIYIYYNDGDGTVDGEDKTNVWDADFMFVHHMDDDPDTSTIDDSTGTHDGTKLAAGEPTEATGKIDKGQNFDGGDGIKEDVAPLTAYPITLSALVKTASGSGGNVVAFLGDKDDDDHYITIEIRSSNGATIGRGVARTRTNAGHGSALGGDDLRDGNWHHLCGTFASATSREIFADGLSKDTDSTNSDPTSVIDRWAIGYLARSVPAEKFIGDIDEVRCSDIVRSDDWIKFEAKNILEADNELTWGSEEEGLTHYTITASAASYVWGCE